MAGLGRRRSSYLDEDIHHLASQTRYPRLQNCHELAEDITATHAKKKRHTEVLQQCFLLQLERHVVQAQREGIVPKDQELATLPLFQEARKKDIIFLKQKYETTCLKAKEEERRRLEEERLEAERKLEREEQKRRRREMKEARRLERMALKKEQAIELHERKKRQYGEAWEKWENTVREQQAVLDSLQEKIRVLEGKRKSSVDTIEKIDKDKESLLETLREAVVKSDGSQPKKDETAPSASRLRHDGKNSFDSRSIKSSSSKEYRPQHQTSRKRDDPPRGYHSGARYESTSIRRGPPLSARYDRGSKFASDARDSAGPRPKHYKSSSYHDDVDRYHATYHGRHDRPYKR